MNASDLYKTTAQQRRSTRGRWWMKQATKPQPTKDAEQLPPLEPEPDYGGVLGADGNVYSDADPGL